jgi:hypothetical protein
VVPLSFGVFPLGLAGSPDGLASGAPDDWQAIARAMTELQGDGPPIMPRMYVNWAGPASTRAALAQVEAYAAHAPTGGAGPWDLVLCYHDPDGDTEAWASFAARVVAEYGSQLAAVQVTAEANLTGIPDAADGAFPGAREALARGLLRAAEAKRDAGATAAIGFAVVPEPEPNASGFWTELRQLGGSDFAAAADYAGIDMYPDVFGPPIAIDGLPGAVRWVLQTCRERMLPLAGVPATTPLRVCENGWPTGPGRPEETQARVLETVIRTVSALRAELNVTHWELFALRDADSSRDGLFYRFGVLRDDYSAKPAFGVLRDLIAELSLSVDRWMAFSRPVHHAVQPDNWLAGRCAPGCSVATLTLWNQHPQH